MARADAARMLNEHRLRILPLALSLVSSAVLAAATFQSHHPSPFGASAAYISATMSSSGKPFLESRTPLTITGASRAEREVAEWAVSRFDAAGLLLPPVSVSFRDDGECGGSAGLYRHSEAAVTICNRGGHDNPPRQTVLHELAHAWSLHWMDEADIAAMLIHDDLDFWINDEIGYWNRGAERTAEYIAWGLQVSGDEDRAIWTAGKNCAALATAFGLITGSGPLNVSPAYCSGP